MSLQEMRNVALDLRFKLDVCGQVITVLTSFILKAYIECTSCSAEHLDLLIFLFVWFNSINSMKLSA